MAIEAERLLAIFEARFGQLEKALTKARGDSNKAFGDIEAAGNRASNALANVGSRGTPGIDRMNKAMRVTKFETANVSAQFQDIAVQLAGGQSPFLIALQQGTQLNHVLGQAGARGALSLLSGAFASLLNPVSLATIAIIGLGGTAVQYFAEVLSGSDGSAEALKREADLIQQVATKWGDAVPAIKAYADERARLASEASLQEATNLQIGDIFKQAQAQVQDLRFDLVDLVTQLQDAGASDTEIARIQQAFEAFTGAVNENRDSTAENKELLTALSTAYVNSGVPAANDFASAIYNIADAFAAFAAQAAEAKAQADAAIQAGRVAAMQKTLPGNLGQLSPLYSGSGRFMNQGEAQDARAGAIRSQTQIAAERAARAGGRSKGASDAEREAEAVAKLIDRLEYEYSLIGMSAEERKVANALRQAGAAATDQQRERIEALVLATEREREALKASEEAMRELQDISRDFFQGFAEDLLSGKTAAEALEGALKRLASRLLDSAFDRLFSGFGAGVAGRGGGLLGGLIIPGILHKGGVAGQDGYGHGRAVSPSVFAGAQRYHKGGIAGLRPGEVPAILERGERVVPRGGRGGGGGGTVINMPVTIDATGADAAGLARVERQLADLKRTLPTQVDGRKRAEQVRGTRP